MNWFFAIASFVFGLVFGSFLNVCIYRLPRGRSVVSPRSACPQCETPIAFYDNVPVLSWLILRGRCRRCKAPISPRYVMVEWLTACLFLACFERFGLTLATLKYAVFGFLLLGLIFTDAETKLLPDKLTIPGVFVGLIFSWFVPVNDLLARFLPGFFTVPLGSSWRLLSVADSLLGAVMGASFIYGAGAIYLRVRHVEGMGFGDVKLMAMIGAFLGLKLTVFTLFTASVAGSVFGISTMLVVWFKRTRRRIERQRETPAVARRRAWQSARMIYQHYEMPFGVFLGSMAIFAFFFGDTILRWYWGQFS